MQINKVQFKKWYMQDIAISIQRAESFTEANAYPSQSLRKNKIMLPKQPTSEVVILSISDFSMIIITSFEFEEDQPIFTVPNMKTDCQKQ